MARDMSFMESLLKWPWRVCGIALVLGNIFFRLIIPAWFSGTGTPGQLSPAVQGAFSQTMPSVADLFSIFIVGAMILSLTRERFLRRKISGSDLLPYKSRDVLFTPAELNFLNTLEQSLNKNYRIYGKVRLCDIIETMNDLDKRTHQKAFNRISSKHVDFVICNARSLAIEMVIELDDSTHKQSERRARDWFLNAALKAAEIPIVRFQVKRAYALRELQAKLGDFVVSAQEPVERKAVEGVEAEGVVAARKR